MQDVVIVAATRTAVGSFQGSLANIPAPELGAAVIRRLLEQTGLDPALVDEVILGQQRLVLLQQAQALLVGAQPQVGKAHGLGWLRELTGSFVSAWWVLVVAVVAMLLLTGIFSPQSNTPIARAVHNTTP